MYEYLIGEVTFVSPNYIVVETNGIGYQISVSNPYVYQEGTTVKIYLQQVVREDAQLLYGFFDLAEKKLFLLLVSVSGIGPKSALAILAGNNHSGLQEAIAREDVKFLMKYPGVGKKTAQQMILDLKGKVGGEALGDLLAPVETAPDAAEEALAALKALGYSEKEMQSVKKNITDTSLTTEQYISAGLKWLMKK